MDVPEEFDDMPMKGAAIAINFMKASESAKPNLNYHRKDMEVSPIQKLYHKAREDSIDTPKLLNAKIKDLSDSRIEPQEIYEPKNAKNLLAQNQILTVTQQKRNEIKRVSPLLVN